MRIGKHIAERAYLEFGRKYGRREKATPWDVPAHAELWRYGRQAIQNNDTASFNSLQKELRSYWSIGRGRNQKELEASAIHQVLLNVPSEFHTLRLSELSHAHMRRLYDAVVAASQIKQNKDGASVMAMSKYLHFLNPRLFVIVDREMIWSYVLNHDYLWHPILEMRENLRPIIPDAEPERRDGACDLFSYVAILDWCGELLRVNPELPDIFLNFVHKCCGEKPFPKDTKEYDAAAVEWLLLGLVEIPPYERMV